MFVYLLLFAEDIEGKKSLCTLHLTKEDVAKFTKAIDQLYYYEMIYGEYQVLFIFGETYIL